MNAIRAKALRRQIYGDTSLKIERRYFRMVPRFQEKTGKLRPSWGTIINDPASPRAQYQRAKKGGEG